MSTRPEADGAGPVVLVGSYSAGFPITPLWLTLTRRRVVDFMRINSSFCCTDTP